MTLLTTLLVTVIALNLVGFVVAYLIKSDKLTDFMYGFSFFIIAVVAFGRGVQNIPTALLLAMVSIWAFRLAGFLVIRILKIKRDKRFDGVRESFVKFGFFWMIQAITAWVVMLPSMFFFNNPTDAVSLFMMAGIAIWITGFLFETTADLQKFRFNNNPENKGKWISSGLWSKSRHPNYFGEILVWVGVYLYAFSALDLSAKLIGLISPLLIICLLMFFSGVPKLEKAADKKWGDVKEYKKYKKDTPLLIPKI